MEDVRYEIALLPGTLVLTVSLFLVWFAYIAFWIPRSEYGRFCSSQPWLGVRKQAFSRFRAGVSSVKNTRAFILEGYKQFSVRDMAFMLPQFANEPILVLPPSVVDDYVQKPDSQVDPHDAQAEQIAVEYTIGTDLLKAGTPQTVIRRHITRKLPMLTADVHTEVVAATKAGFGANVDTWTEVAAYSTCMKIVAQAANRVFAGPELCRNAQFLEASRLYAISVFGRAGVIGLIPTWLRPILGPLIALPLRWDLQRCFDHALPTINQKVKEYHDTINKGEHWTPSNDAISWLILEGSGLGDSAALDPKMLCRQLLFLNIVAIHTTSMTITNTVLDLFSSPRRDEFVDALREETTRVLKANNNEWSKETVNQLLRTDSAVKESMRLSNLGHVGIGRLVIDPNGATFAGGIHVPAGVRLVLPKTGIHRDARNYESPETWDALRFSRPREEYLAAAQSARGNLEQKNTALITTSNSFLSFGHGRHACPGRFFASQEMKLMLAHIVMQYDVRVEGGRPPNFQFGSNSVPPDTAKLEVRLRTL